MTTASRQEKPSVPTPDAAEVARADAPEPKRYSDGIPYCTPVCHAFDYTGFGHRCDLQNGLTQNSFSTCMPQLRIDYAELVQLRAKVPA